MYCIRSAHFQASQIGAPSPSNVPCVDFWCDLAQGKTCVVVAASFMSCVNLEFVQDAGIVHMPDALSAVSWQHLNLVMLTSDRLPSLRWATAPATFMDNVKEMWLELDPCP
jgi:hypothetical protein